MHSLPRVVSLPVLRHSIPVGIEYGSNLLVEFTPDSIWYETSFTIAAGALKDGLKTQYHTFQRSPDEVRENLTKLDLNVKKLEEGGVLRILDSYTTQLGLRGTEETGRLKLSDISIVQSQRLKAGYPEERKRAGCT